MDAFNLDSYQIAWLAFVKGLLIGIILTLIFT